MSDRLDNAEPTPSSTEAKQPEEVKSEPTAVAAAAEPPAGEKLDDIENIDFLLEEIENKIAPLALA